MFYVGIVRAEVKFNFSTTGRGVGNLRTRRKILRYNSRGGIELDQDTSAVIAIRDITWQFAPRAVRQHFPSLRLHVLFRANARNSVSKYGNTSAL